MTARGYVLPEVGKVRTGDLIGASGAASGSGRRLGRHGQRVERTS